MAAMPNQDAPTSVIENAQQLPPPFRETFIYWETRRGDRWAPDWASFHLDDLPPAILPWSVIVDVEREPRNFRYRFWGTERTNLIGTELTGLRATDITPAEMRQGNILEYEDVCARRQPLLCQTPITTNTGRHAVFLSIRLPLSDDGDTVTHIYSAIDYAQISTVHYEIFGTVPDSRVPAPEASE